WEANLREKLESLWGVEGHFDLLPPQVTWSLPFSEHIDNIPIPSQFRELVIDLFDGSQDSFLKAIPEYVKGVAMRWFLGLLPHFVTSFADLTATFESQFVANKTKRLKVAYLFAIKQSKTKTLKWYLVRFNVAMVQVDDPDQKFFIKALQKGLRQHVSPFLTDQYDRDQSLGGEACGGRGRQLGPF
ncbi:hypothetical protein CR513_53755, partial [Mucuna pruriens]